MAAGNDARHLVAIVSGEWIRVERAATGACRLPVLPEKDTWPDLANLVALAGDTRAHVAAPTNRWRRIRP
jgi:hypothetical protein